MSDNSPAALPASTRDLVLRLVREHVRPHLPRLLLAMLCMAVAAGGTAALAYFMQPVMDDVFIKKDRDMLIFVPVVVILITLVKGAATYAQAVLMAFVGARNTTRPSRNRLAVTTFEVMTPPCRQPRPTGPARRRASRCRGAPPRR